MEIGRISTTVNLNLTTKINSRTTFWVGDQIYPYDTYRAFPLDSDP